ncbi:hypothetical protein TNCV_3905631 [Trichonephila clavipes]|nr:hypothetical protein TNCV_3905631 [Trichonephila clavipes]
MATGSYMTPIYSRSQTQVLHFPQTNSGSLPLSSLVQIDNGASMLNGLLHSNDYAERRVTRCIVVLPTAPHSSGLDTSSVAKSLKEKLQKSPSVA